MFSLQVAQSNISTERCHMVVNVSKFFKINYNREIEREVVGLIILKVMVKIIFLYRVQLLIKKFLNKVFEVIDY